MKKLISMLLAVVMVFALATAASAAEINGENDLTGKMDVVTSFTKQYQVLSGVAPDEAFAFTVAYQSFVNQDGVEAVAEQYPVVTLGKATFANDMAAGTYNANASVTISGYAECALGVYTYQITEVDNNIAGVNYVADPVFLNVTVLRDEDDMKHYVAAIHYATVTGEKTGETVNTYEAGSLNVTKKTTGNMADVIKKFPITVVFKAETGDAFKEVSQVQIANDNATTNRTYNYRQISEGEVSVTFELADGETAAFTNIPLGTTYTVQETALFGYNQVSATGENVANASITEGGKTVTSRIVSGEISESNGVDNAGFVNELKTAVDTGVSMDSAPYYMILVMTVFGMVALASKKRYEI